MHADRPAGTPLLSLLYAVSGTLCLLGALNPLTPETPVGLLWVLAVIGCGGAALLWLRRQRLSTGAVHVAVATMATLIALLAWRSVTAVGVVGLGPSMVALAVYTAHYLPRPAARAHAVYLLAVTTAGALAAAPSGIALPWLTNVVTVAALVEAQTRISATLHRAAGTDPLTGLANRRAWEAGAERSLAHAARSGEPLTVVLLDLDGFKTVNDEDGHGAGDALLQSLAGAWSSELRTADLLGRYGGDEFVLCLPGTDAARTQELVARLRASHPASWSAGTAAAAPGDTLADLLRRADTDLYRHKASRR
ncbi:GGDEF domain-containing protein [Geodermatophilus ruber]|uniref:Diguanylate cyclase (GGDEF) domain-containing protein n=1 Tax=Geodermatophilus ruber TaxID=504800 RepID=A0A1I4GT36_9ACTN|nr:GGDEF domain-containing protein [Geodermatophilus ruber]SFL33069.1 diguanylate cyclase (GGDEF) domain-containing protein [Geodermatophilus ruber]